MKTDTETTDAVLVDLGEALMTSEGVDADLAKIVVEHILAPEPAQDCVEQAMKAIHTLAAVRLTPSEELSDG